ncbi:hypothetical protein EBB07_07545 [Paenibacillaceae bacterium]|nr:hypothetical protein EBB07_07545 [Paenibacillaceae bacterium]
MNGSILRKLALRCPALALAAIAFALLVIWPVGTGSAHSSLTDAFPAPDSRLETAPQEIVLTFNERLENKGFAVQIYDRKGMPAAKGPAALDASRNTMRLALPPLEDGSYTITYRLLSADGHPIRASYVFTIGAAADSQLGYASASRLHEEHDIGKNMPYWITRGLYYLGLLTATGWFSLRVYAPDIARVNLKRYSIVGKALLAFHLVALVLLAWNDFGKLSEGLALTDDWSILLGTSIGVSYAIALPTAVIGLLILGKWRAIDAAWIILLFAAKGLNGHAMGFAIPAITYVLDIVHLAAASLWSGVLLAFAIIGTKRLAEPGAAGAAPPALLLSRAALSAIALLAVSGLAAAALYTNGFHRLLDSQWGRLMLAKAAAVLLVIIVGSALRRSLRQKRLKPRSPWLLFDFALYAIIVAITAVLTYLNPLAATGPLFWHENVKSVHIAAVITPNKAGEVNQFNVSVGGGAAKEGEGGPRNVTLKLQSIDHPDIAAIDVPLKLVQTNGSPLSLYDYNYSAEGNYLSLPGRWKLEVRVLSGKLNEYVTVKTFYSDNKK